MRGRRLNGPLSVRLGSDPAELPPKAAARGVFPMSQTATSPSKTGLKGLSIERRFSTAGTHPFDEVEWEIRDAVIGDPADPAFEQRGVEFPKSWSQNATNIVAQKYFR